MVVDSNLESQSHTKNLFEKAGLSCTVSENGLKALESYKKLFESSCGCKLRVPPLIIMQISTPVIDGEAASTGIQELLKQAESSQLSNIVALTTESQVEACTALGLKDVYSQPLNDVTFASIISKYNLK